MKTSTYFRAYQAAANAADYENRMLNLHDGIDPPRIIRAAIARAMRRERQRDKLAARITADGGKR